MIRLSLKLLSVCILLSGLATADDAMLVDKAQKGDARAQFVLGYKYATGDGVPKDTSEAAIWYRKAAEQDHAFAQAGLGVAYADGEGVPKDRSEAAIWYRKAADQGVAIAQYNLGSLYASGDGVPKDSTEAVKWWHKAAEQGDVEAQLNLSVMYARGEGVPKDSTKAVTWARKAAEQGNTLAQNGLGAAYANGEGVPKDSIQAVKWYRMAAEQGNADAQGNLGSMYSIGEGAPKDAIEGLAWINIAAASGSQVFVTNRGILERRLGPEVTLAAQQRSKQIMKEIEAAKRARSSSAPNDSVGSASPAAELPISSGSGAIVSIEGHILTAAHVVTGASSLRILTSQGMKPAKALLIDEANDLAVLKLETGTYPTLPVASSRKIRLGQAVATIGFPNVQIQGFSPKVTRGEISSLNGIGDDPRAWQISVPVQTGNSGGPLLDENGNLIGIVVSKLGLKAAEATGDLPQNVNYAVKSSYALALLEPYLSDAASGPNQGNPKFEDMVAKAQQSVVLILVY